jgi:hypothetical protein
VVPSSAREIIFKLMSNYLSNMNNLAIKSEVSGGAFVYNPSHNIVTVYDDAKGNVLKRSDVLYEIHKLKLKSDAGKLGNNEMPLMALLREAKDENQEIEIFL